MRKIIIVIMLCAIICVSCAAKNETSASKTYERYRAEFMGPFNTLSIILGYTETQEEFDNYVGIIYDKLVELDKKYTIYDSYDGINNIRTINKMAGIEPVEVDKEIIDMLIISKDAYKWSDGTVNIALGAVLSIWHDYRTVGRNNPDIASLPPMSDLEAAMSHTNMEDLIIDEENNTVFLCDPKMSLDVGATAKGYAAYLAVEEAKKAGMVSALVNIGGNTIAVGKPLDAERQRWGIGIRNPDLRYEATTNVIDTVFLNEASVVCSGNYEQYYTVDGIDYNHIIDPETLMPAVKYKSVSVIMENSEIADALSTALFLMDIKDGAELAASFDAEVLWILNDNTMEATDGYAAISKVLGNYSSVDK